MKRAARPPRSTASGAAWLLTAAATFTPAAAAQVATPVEIDWQPCALRPSDTVDTAECALVPLPLDHDDPAAGAIGIAVMRLRRGSEDGAQQQLWYLAGGPGDAGIGALPQIADLFDEIDDEIDLYALDHRGTGGSGLLSCPAQEARDSPGGREITAEEWPACMAAIHETRGDLPLLTVTQAAHDVGSLLATARQPGDRLFLFGASYGSYWANRVLALFPERVDGVILDGLVPPDWSFAEFDAGLDAAGRRLLASCADQAECAAHLGPDPLALAAALPDRLDAGHCSALGADGRTGRLLLGNLLMGGPEIWPWIPGLIHRLDRCRFRDLLAIGEMVERLFESGDAGSEPESHSPALQRHVSLSELWPEPPPDPEALAAAIGTTIMTTAVSASFAATRESWPVYTRPEATGFAAYDGPMLLLHGGLDPTMPVERLAAMRTHFAGPRQRFVNFPYAGHVVVNNNPCARSLYRDFLRDPEAPLDRSCVAASAVPPNLAGVTDADSLFGTRDYWGDRISALEWLLGGAALLALTALVLTARWWLRRRR